MLTATSGTFASDDVLDLVGYTSTDTAAVSFNSGTDTTPLTIYTSSDAVVQTFTLAGDQVGTWFVTPDTSATGIDVYDPPTVTTATIANAGSLDINGPSSENVTFTGGTGALVLDDPRASAGQIVGFTGTAPDAAHSDTVDLVGINYDLRSLQKHSILQVACCQ